MLDVRLLAGEEIVQANHVVLFSNQTLTQVRAEKTRPASDQNSLDARHIKFPIFLIYLGRVLAQLDHN
jgi:hypothetical protein